MLLPCEVTLMAPASRSFAPCPVGFPILRSYRWAASNAPAELLLGVGGPWASLLTPRARSVPVRSTYAHKPFNRLMRKSESGFRLSLL
jgi:hypothetical protein